MVAEYDQLSEAEPVSGGKGVLHAHTHTYTDAAVPVHRVLAAFNQTAGACLSHSVIHSGRDEDEDIFITSTVTLCSHSFTVCVCGRVHARAIQVEVQTSSVALLTSPPQLPQPVSLHQPVCLTAFSLHCLNSILFLYHSSDH